jgi:microcystin-dependent protein
MASPYIAQITLFAGNFAPRGWAFCDGQIMAISQNTALFSLLGTTYGGDGRTTFALPDLRGRAPVHAGSSGGPGLTPRLLGEQGGEEAHTLTQNEMPSHAHGGHASSSDQTTNRPSGAYPARGGVYASSQNATTGPGEQIGGGQPHANMQPYLGLNYIIAVEGIFPSRN